MGIPKWSSRIVKRLDDVNYVEFMEKWFWGSEVWIGDWRMSWGYQGVVMESEGEEMEGTVKKEKRLKWCECK